MRKFEIRDLTKAVGKSDMGSDVIEAVLQAVEEFHSKVEHGLSAKPPYDSW